MFENNTNNYYTILDIKPDASQNDIRQAYFRAKSAYSKDSAALYSIFDSQETHLILEKIEQAYLVLSNVEKRKEYDKVHGFLSMNDATPTPTFEESTNIYSFVKSSMQTADAAHQAAQTVLSGSSLDDQDDIFNTPSSPDSKQKQNVQSTNVPTLMEPSHFQTQTTQSTTATTSQPQTSFFDSFNSNSPSNNQSTKIQDVREFETKMGIVKRVDLIKPVTSSQDPVIENEIKNETEFRGAFLKKIREYRNISLEELCEFTKISKSYLASIETEEFDNLPASVYVRGFIVQVAKALKLPPDKVATGYMSHYKKTFLKS